MKNYRIFYGNKNETWLEALERFNKFCEADMKEYFPNKDYSYRFTDNAAYQYYPIDKVSIESIESFTITCNMKVPKDLMELLCKHGPFRIGNSLIEIFDDIGIDTFLTLPQILSMYGYSDFINRVPPGMLKSLSNYYSFFGISFPQSEEISFLFFSKSGNFGKMLFAPNNEALVLQKIIPSMFNGNIDKYSLDSLISNQIDRIITNALTVRGYID